MKTYKIAVTSTDKELIDLHFGHVEEFHIYNVDENDVVFIETRKGSKFCSGPECNQADKANVLDLLSDCDALVTKMIGHSPEQKLLAKGVKSFIMFNRVIDGLKIVYEKLNIL